MMVYDASRLEPEIEKVLFRAFKAVCGATLNLVPKFNKL